MKYFFDTEFIEGFHKPLFGKRRHFVDLISIGIVCEDGRTYYAVSTDFKSKDANEWVKENVIAQLPLRVNLSDISESPRLKQESLVWKPNKQIAHEIYQFICPYEQASLYAGCGSIDEGSVGYLKTNPPEFYAYYADYDWVVFCSLFGTLMQLPKGFPMYCRDLKQMLDEKIERTCSASKEKFDEALDRWKQKEDYPEQKDEHNALSDARWNKKLYDFLISK